MPSNFDNAYIQQYDTNINLAFQQRESRLLRTVELDSMAGINKFFDRLGADSAPAVRSTRFAPLAPVDSVFSRRILTPVSYESDKLVDSFDMLRMSIDPSSKLVENQMLAFHRLIDDTIIGGLTGVVYAQGTVNGPISGVSPLSGNTVAVNYCEPGTSQTGNQGLTVGKLKAARNILFPKEAVQPEEELFCVINELQTNQLLRDPQVTNIFYQDAKPLIEGAMVARFLGFTFIRSERIPNSALLNSSAPFPTALVYPASAMKFSWLEPLTGDAGPATWLQGKTHYLKAMASFGAARMWEEKVIQILTDPTQ